MRMLAVLNGARIGQQVRMADTTVSQSAGGVSASVASPNVRAMPIRGPRDPILSERPDDEGDRPDDE